MLTIDLALNYAPANCTVSSYNFASPMVGDPGIAQFFNGYVGSGKKVSANFRVANGVDVVPYLPPSVIYAPISGEEYNYVQVDGYCPVDSGASSILSDAHSLSNYVIGLNRISSPEEARRTERAASAMGGIPKPQTEASFESGPLPAHVS